MEKVAIFGSSGQLGADLVDCLQTSGGFDVIPLTRQDADCRDADAVRKVVLHARPHIVINCAAYVRVDDCEDHPRDAFEVNAIGALNVARACAEVDACCVYVSTDYVFDGKKEAPYVESDLPNPINVYGASKLAGENLVRQSAPRWLIVRVSSLFGKTGARGKGGNFIEAVLAKAKKGEALTVVDDIRISPTYTRDMVEALADLLVSRCDGFVHLSNCGECTWFEFATKILELTGFAVCVESIGSKDYPSKARRPTNSTLGSVRGEKLLRSWDKALEAYLQEKSYLPRLLK